MSPDHGPTDAAAVDRTFQVDLGGLVDLLARHLYSGPRVYLRELLQNAVDAITARTAIEPDAPRTVRMRCEDDGLEVVDTGIGLTAPEAAELLATIGRSSKRDLVLGVGREEFLGQFGIGLLSAFMVADEIELVSRSATGAEPILWCGRSDGTYRLSTTDEDVPVGSRLRLRPRADMRHWLERETVISLAEDFGSLLPVDIAVEVPVAGRGSTWRRVTEPELPWHGEPGPDRDAALSRYCERVLGFTPLAHIDLSVPLAGLSGVAFVLPGTVSPASARAHRVYVKRMLLGTPVADVLPEWGFFVRCVLDASGLRPTASREALYEDEVLLAARDVLGAQVQAWLADVLSTPSPRRRAVLEAHHLAVRAMAVTDDTMLDTAATVLPYETTDGPMTLADVADAHGRIWYTTTVEEFRRIAPVARSQRLTVVNGGYVYDDELLRRLATRRPGWRIRALRTDDVRHVLTPVEPLRELEVTDALVAATDLLRRHDVEVCLRSYEPADLPAVLLDDRDRRHQRDLARTAEVKDLWGDVLGSFVGSGPVPTRQLVLNDANPTIRRLLATRPGPVRDAAVRSVYIAALLLAGEPLRRADADLMNDSLSVLLDAGLTEPERRDEE